MSETKATPASAVRYAHLDSLRGLAAILVIWMHGSEAFVVKSTDKISNGVLFQTANTLHFGRIGVVIFFILSGYLIAASLHADHWKKTFPVKRFLRLYPAFVFSIVAISLARNTLPGAGELLANLTMLPTLFGSDQIMGLYWTLETEVLFYAAFYGLLLLGFARTKKSLAIITLALTAVFIVTELCIPTFIPEPSLLIKKLPQHLGIMFAGAYLYENKKAPGDRRMTLAVLAAILIPPLGILADVLMQKNHEVFPMTCAYPVAIFIALVFFKFEWTTGVLAKFGKISYSAYLNHAVILFLYAPHAGRFGLLADMIFLLGATWVVSAGTYRLIEAPFIALSKRLTMKPSAKPVIKPAALPTGSSE